MPAASKSPVASLALFLLCCIAPPLRAAGAFAGTRPSPSRGGAFAAAGGAAPARLPRPSTTSLYFFFDDGGDSGEEDTVRGDPSDRPSESAALHEALRARRGELDKKIGLRYLICTKDKGHVRVHRDPKLGPYATHNVVAHLEHGKIVRSIGEPFGNWVHHEMGWSLAKHQGFDFLVLIEE